MKHLSILSLFTLMSMVLMGCSQETTKIKNSSDSQNPYCQANYSTPGCPGYTGGSGGGTTGGGTGGTGGSGNNPYPNYYSDYINKYWIHQYTLDERNWNVHYPFIPSISCSEAKSPTNINYTPYETRKGTITLAGKKSYDPTSGQAYFETTSQLLQTVSGARNFFWGDSTLKIRFKANLQPESAKSPNVCPDRVPGQSSLKGYGKIMFDLTLVGRRGDNSEGTKSYYNQVIDVNKCSPALDLSKFAEDYPNGIYIKISNMRSNKGWQPGTHQEQYTYNSFGFITPQNKDVEGTWTPIRDAECWSIDVEVAADGTKTFD